MISLALQDTSVLRAADIRIQVGPASRRIHAVNGVSLALAPGETVGIVGESGSGKSLFCRSLLGLLPEGATQSGEIFWEGKSTAGDSEITWRKRRGPVAALIPQDPMTSLHPGLSIATQMTETIRAHRKISRADALDRAIQALLETGITDAEKRIHDWPHQFSGGMRQRVLIATALMLEPKVLIADEPATALDVTVQSRILDLLAKLREKHGMALILVSHDLAVVARIASRIHVMYGGRFLEAARGSDLFTHPLHPYTQGLLASLPENLDRDNPEPGIPGQPPQFLRDPGGCVFYERSPLRRSTTRPRDPSPEWKELSPGHFVESCRCCFP